MDNEVGRLEERLSIALGDKSVRSVAQLAGVSEGTLRNILSGGTPRVDNLVSIAEACGVRLEWLAIGKGEMTEEASPSSPDVEPQQAAVIASKAVDQNLFQLVIQWLRSDESMFKDVKLELLISEVLAIYNRVVEVAESDQEALIRLEINLRGQALVGRSQSRTKGLLADPEISETARTAYEEALEFEEKQLADLEALEAKLRP
jgi:transcriptional regulator with XRE-family HTH domain